MILPTIGIVVLTLITAILIMNVGNSNTNHKGVLNHGNLSI